MAVVLTLVQTKQITINIHKRSTIKTQYNTLKIQVYILPKHPHCRQSQNTLILSTA